MKKKTKRFLHIFLRLAVSSLALYYVLSKTDLKSLLDLLRESNILYLIAACLFFIVSKIVSAFRLNLFFKAAGINLPAKTNLRLYWLGMFYNLFLPGGIGGDGYKVYYLRKNQYAPVKKSLLALIFDRITGLIALIVLCLLFGFFLKQDLISEWYFILTIILVVICFYFIIYQWFNIFYKTLNLTNIQSLIVQVAQVISAWLILFAIGNDQQMISYLFVFLISSVVAVIPFTVGGVGAREITFLYAAELLHLDLPISITLSLLFFSITMLVSLFGIWYVVRPELISGEKLSDNDVRNPDR